MTVDYNLTLCPLIYLVSSEAQTSFHCPVTVTKMRSFEEKGILKYRVVLMILKASNTYDRWQI